MRAAPPVDLPLSRGTGLHLLSAVLHGLAATGLLAWALAWAQAEGQGLAPVPGLLASPVAGAGLPRVSSWQLVGGLMAGALLGAALGWRALRGVVVPAGAVLRWDGQCWALIEAAGAAGPAGLAAATAPAAAGHGWPLRSVARQIDLDRWVLLRLQPAPGQARWAVASAVAAPAVWHAARVALVAHGGGSPVGSASA